MGLADGIRKHGFRNWHERELLGSHGWLVVTLLCAVGAFAALEALMGSRLWIDRATNTVVIAACGAVGIVALRLFLERLVRAQTVAEQAKCPQCETFGRLKVIAEGHHEPWVRVGCRKCAHEWVIRDRNGAPGTVDS